MAHSTKTCAISQHRPLKLFDVKWHSLHSKLCFTFLFLWMGEAIVHSSKCRPPRCCRSIVTAPVLLKQLGTTAATSRYNSFLLSLDCLRDTGKMRRRCLNIFLVVGEYFSISMRQCYARTHFDSVDISSERFHLFQVVVLLHNWIKSFGQFKEPHVEEGATAVAQLILHYVADLGNHWSWNDNLIIYYSRGFVPQNAVIKHGSN